MRLARHAASSLNAALATTVAGVVFLCCSLFIALCPQPVRAATLDTVQQLDFGLLASRHNDNVSSVLLRHRGEPVMSLAGGGLLLIVPGTPGRYQLSGLPPFVPLEITIGASEALSLGGQGAGERLTLDSFTFDTLSADGSGNATLLLGATLRTSATTLPYAEGPYLGSFGIQVRYWSPEDQVHVTREFGVFARVELRSSIALEVIEPLRFGSLSAFAHPLGDPARLTLSPDGALQLRNQPPASLGVIAGAAAGRVRISGAAPSQILQVVFDPPTVFLTHNSGNPESARFEAGDFTHAPAGLAFRADANGNLEFSVGATLRTELTDRRYFEGGYSGQVTVTVHY